MKPKAAFVHPLSALETVITEEGDSKRVMNSWAFASVVWASAVNGNPQALKIVNELFTDKSRFTRTLEDSKSGGESATREAIVIVAFALDEKIAEAFDLQK